MLFSFKLKILIQEKKNIKMGVKSAAIVFSTFEVLIGLALIGLQVLIRNER